MRSLRASALLLAGALLLIALDQAGRAVVSALSLPLPGSVVGMLLLVVLLHFRFVPPFIVSPAAELFTRHLALFYVPAGVAILAYLAVIRGQVLIVSTAAAASLIAVLLVVGMLVERNAERAG